MDKCYRCDEVISMCPCDESTYTADDEISRLRAELEHAREERDSWRGGCDWRDAEITRLRAELAECKRDAETAERERCVTICKAIMLYHGGMAETATDNEERAFREGESCGAEDCIEAIENGLDPRIECVLRQI